jgi:hypothetical protein
MPMATHQHKICHHAIYLEKPTIYSPKSIQDIMKIISGNHIIILKNQMVFAATEIEIQAQKVAIKFKGTETLIGINDIATIHQTGEINQIPIDPAILSTLATLETGIRNYEKSGGSRCHYTICGGTSLTLTLIPNRTTEDIDIITQEPIEKFLNKENLHWDYSIEFLDERSLFLMGNWKTRTSDAIGPTGIKFQIMHPLDTIMQKLLRWSDKDFAIKDWPDIKAIHAILQPTKNTLKKLLTENPARFTKGIGPIAAVTDAIETNTRTFIAEFLPGTTYEKLAETAYINLTNQLEQAHLLPPIPNVDLQQKIKPLELE